MERTSANPKNTRFALPFVVALILSWLPGVARAATFIKLRADSDLIDRGSNVGLLFFGAAADLGAFETDLVAAAGAGGATAVGGMTGAGGETAGGSAGGAGAGGTSGGGVSPRSTAAGASPALGDAGAVAAAAGGESGGGCSCRLAGFSGHPLASALAVLAYVAALLQPRRRARASREQ